MIPLSRPCSQCSLAMSRLALKLCEEMMTNKMIPTLVLAGLLTGCATTVTHTSLTDSSLLAQASSGALAISDGAVITGKVYA